MSAPCRFVTVINRGAEVPDVVLIDVLVRVDGLVDVIVQTRERAPSVAVFVGNGVVVPVSDPHRHLYDGNR